MLFRWKSHTLSHVTAAESVYVETLTSSAPCQVNGLPGEGQRGPLGTRRSLSRGDRAGLALGTAQAESPLKERSPLLLEKGP